MRDLQITDWNAGLITPSPTLVPVDVQRYGSANAQAGLDFVQWHTAPNPYLPILITVDPLAIVDAGRQFYLAGYTTDLPVADVDAQLGLEAQRMSATSRG